MRRNEAQRALLIGDTGADANEREQRIAAVLDGDRGSDADDVAEPVVKQTRFNRTTKGTVTVDLGGGTVQSL